MRPTTPNILRVYDAATSEQLRDGMTWYADANALARSLDPFDPERAAAVIAVLSPMKEWDQNAALARRAYADCGLNGGTLGDHVRKVNLLLRDRLAPEAVVSGQKVRAFWQNIVTNGESDMVTIDRHAFDVAVGRRLDDSRRGQVQRVTPGSGGYSDCERAYLRAARQRDVWGAQLQAVTWIVWRDLYKYSRKVV